MLTDTKSYQTVRFVSVLMVQRSREGSRQMASVLETEIFPEPRRVICQAAWAGWKRLLRTAPF